MNLEEPQSPDDSNQSDDGSSGLTPADTPAESSGETPEATNEADPPAPATPPDGLGIESALNRANVRVSSVASAIQFSGTLSLAIGGLALVSVAFFLLYGMPQVESLLDPKLAVPRIEQLLEDEGLPALRKYATDFAKNNSKDVAKQLNQKVIDGLPKIRELLEDTRRLLL